MGSLNNQPFRSLPQKLFASFAQHFGGMKFLKDSSILLLVWSFWNWFVWKSAICSSSLCLWNCLVSHAILKDVSSLYNFFKQIMNSLIIW